MAVTRMIPVDEYLRTVYRPDCDYVDGEVLERNIGEVPHGQLQAFFAFYFRLHRGEWQVNVLTETRVQVTATRFRIPDVLLTSVSARDERIIRTSPLLCIEILSSEDRMRRVQEHVEDYAGMGVPCTWVVDPWRRTASQAGPDAVLREATERLTVPGTSIAVSVAELFDELEHGSRAGGSASGE